MIYLSDFDIDFKGRTFRDRNISGSDLTCVGYGDNGDNGNPYFMGMYANTARGVVGFRTVLVKNSDFITPKTPKPSS